MTLQPEPITSGAILAALAEINGKMDVLATKMEGKVNLISMEIDAVRERITLLERFKWYIGIIITIAAMFAAIIWDWTKENLGK